MSVQWENPTCMGTLFKDPFLPTHNYKRFYHAIHHFWILERYIQHSRMWYIHSVNWISVYMIALMMRENWIQMAQCSRNFKDLSYWLIELHTCRLGWHQNCHLIHTNHCMCMRKLSNFKLEDIVLVGMEFILSQFTLLRKAWSSGGKK